VSDAVADRYASVVERIAAACARSDRSPSRVRLVAITKTFSVATIRQLLACGHDLLGENRVQEVLPKMDQLAGEAVWHFVGHLQRNKVKQITGRFELIHSVDSERLAREIDRRAGEQGIRQAILLEVNVAGEESKFGLASDRVPEVVRAVRGLSHLRLRGLMAVPPPVERPEDNRRWFVMLRELRDRAAESAGVELPDLSMGMTDDFEVAIEEGATLVRVGRAIFGER
jgi:pyridoxal phosphate enzyme (YggS family)